jgi:hypothetical protein
VIGETRAEARQRAQAMLEPPGDTPKGQTEEEWGTSPEAIASGERAQAMLGDAAQEDG